MKRIQALIPLLVLTVIALVGCGCRNSKPVTTTAPTTAPTTQATTAPTTAPTTMPTTQPTTAPTEATIEDGNGPLPTDSARGGNMPRGNGGITDSIGSGSGITGSITG